MQFEKRGRRLLREAFRSEWDWVVGWKRGGVSVLENRGEHWSVPVNKNKRMRPNCQSTFPPVSVLWPCLLSGGRLFTFYFITYVYCMLNKTFQINRFMLWDGYTTDSVMFNSPSYRFSVVNFNLVEVFFLLLFPSTQMKHITDSKTIWDNFWYFIFRETATLYLLKLCNSQSPQIVA